MRHKVYGAHLGRTSNERTALFKNLVRSLILHSSIQTTDAKAKAIKGMVDKIITQAKSPATRRLVSQFLVEKTIQDKLFKEILPLMKDRTSGYTSVVKLGKRLGDGTMMVQMSLITSEKITTGEIKKEVKEKTDTKKIEEKVTAPKVKTVAKKAVKKETK